MDLMKQRIKREKRGNPGYPEEVKRCAKDTKLMNPDDSARVILAKLKKFFPRYASVQRSLEERTVRNWIEKVKLPEPEDEDLYTWNLGMSHKFGIPPEANKGLLQVWRYSLAIGHPLTIREARWTACLLSAFAWQNEGEKESRRIMRLRYYACIYARREWGSGILGETCDTPDLDAGLFMPLSEYEMAAALGDLPAIPWQAWPDWPAEQREKLEKEKLSIKVGSPFRGSSAGEHVLWDMAKEFGKAYEEFDAFEKVVYSLNDISSVEEDLLFAYSLRYLGKGPKWPSLSEKQHEEVMLRLIDWMKQKRRPPIDPSLLKMVGYDVQEQVDNKGQDEE